MKTALLVLVVFVAGCAASGVQVSQQAAMQFKEGVTTEAEILAKLGKPTHTMITSGMRLISYSGMQYQVKGATFIPIVGSFSGGGDYTMTSVAYQVDSSGIMQKATYSSSGGSSRMGVTPNEMAASEPRAVK